MKTRPLVVRPIIYRPRHPTMVVAVLAFMLGVFSTTILVWQLGPFVAAERPGQAVGVRRLAREATPPPAPDLAAEGTTGRTVDVPEELARRSLAVPVEGVQRSALVDTFEDARGGGGRKHEAIDILAPRNTPVLAVEDGVIARLFTSDAGGLTIYQFDPTERFVYYYAHLERYADNLNQGDRVQKGQVVGYVGTTGNAPRDTPHLHFAIFRMTDEKRWWEGTPIDPYSVLRKVR
jgi:murein DD-endopeptidase MepM/ murein hydrolase activator NlpD